MSKLDEDVDMNDEIFINKINIDNLFRSRGQIIKNNYWNDNHQKILFILQRVSQKLQKEYQRAFIRYSKKLKIYRIPTIIISAIGGFLSVSNSGYIPIKLNKWVSLVVGFTSFLVTLISLIENYKKIDINVNKSSAAYLNFKKLHDEISVVIDLPTNEREYNGHDTIYKFFVRYQTYLTDAPVLNKIIHDTFGGEDSSFISSNNISMASSSSTYNNKYNSDQESDDIEAQINSKISQIPSTKLSKIINAINFESKNDIDNKNISSKVSKMLNSNIENQLQINNKIPSPRLSKIINLIDIDNNNINKLLNNTDNLKDNILTIQDNIQNN